MPHAVAQWIGLALGGMLVVGACSPTSPAGPPSGSATIGDALGQPSGTRTADSDWRAEWDQTVAAARQERTVVVYAPAGDLLRRGMLDGFRKSFPDITLEWAAGRPSELAAKIEAERRAGVYSVDVFLGGTSTALHQIRPIGALDPIKPALILPEVTDPAHWRDHRLDFSDHDQRNLVFVNIPTSLVVYHPGQVRADEVDELQDLLDPKWKGKIAINDPRVGGAGNGTFRFLWEVLGPAKGAEYIRDLRAQAGAVDRDERRQVEWVARGRFPIVVGAGVLLVEQLRDEGVMVEVMNHFNTHGGTVTASGGSLMLINRAPHPHAAKVFVNWLLSKEGQTAWSAAGNQPSLRLDVPTDHLPREAMLRPDGKYWRSYTEESITVPADLTALLNEVFAN
jgi:iron(III) transport system substrate-binding protein